MPHTGRPFPWVMHYDVWEFTHFRNNIMPRRFHMRYNIRKDVVLPNYANRQCNSTVYQIDYVAGHVSWQFILPGPFNAWVIELRRIILPRLEHSFYRWLLYEDGDFRNEADIAYDSGAIGYPNHPALFQWKRNYVFYGAFQPILSPWPVGYNGNRYPPS